MIFIKIKENETTNSLVRRFKRATINVNKEFRKREFFIKPNKRI